MMKKRSLLALGAAAAAGLAAADAADAAVITQWTFETSIPATAGPHLAEVGVGSASGNSGAGYSNPAGNGTAESFSSNSWDVGDYFEFTGTTLGYEDISLVFDTTSSNTGPEDFKVQYSVNGGAYTDSGFTYEVLPNVPGWNVGAAQTGYTVTADLSAIAALDNAAVVGFRLVNTSTESAAAAGGTVAAGGTNRLDTVSINGTVVPEPASLGLLGLGGLALMARRNRR